MTLARCQRDDLWHCPVRAENQSSTSSAVARAMGAGALVIVRCLNRDREKRDFTSPPQCATMRSCEARSVRAEKCNLCLRNVLLPKSRNGQITLQPILWT
jgi:hypothetical protein